MFKVVPVQIKSMGEAKGTVGYLASQEIIVSAGLSKAGLAGCWLKIGNRSERVASQGEKWIDNCVGFRDCPGTHAVELDFRPNVEILEDHPFNTVWTDAAEAAIEKLATLAREEFYKAILTQEGSEEISFSLSVDSIKSKK